MTAWVLIIDDDAVMRSLLRKLLEIAEPGLRVVDAQDGYEAKGLVESGSFKCVVLDHVLPDMTGLDFLRWFRGRDPVTPVVVLTGFGDEALAVDMMKAGANDYLSKVGFSAQRFLEAVRDALGARAAPLAARAIA